MIARMRIAALLVVLAACTGSTPEDTSDRCTGALYDPCSQEHDCLSGLCQPFAGDQVCSQACDGVTPCPGGATCTNAVCEPAVANDCIR